MGSALLGPTMLMPCRENKLHKLMQVYQFLNTFMWTKKGKRKQEKKIYLRHICVVKEGNEHKLDYFKGLALVDLAQFTSHMRNQQAHIKQI